MGDPIMARKPSDKPWLHGASGWWCATIGGKRKKLDKDLVAASRKLKFLRAQAKKGILGNRNWWDASFAQLADEYLDNLTGKKPATYRSFRYGILRALKIIGTTVRVAELRKSHLASIHKQLESDGYSPTTIKDTITTVQGVLNWAVEFELIDTTPWPRYRKPAARRRTRVITRDEFGDLLRHSDRNFQRFLVALRLTGCRPGELRSLIWEWVDLDQELWIIPEHKTITRQRERQPRMIPLPPRIVRMCRRLARQPHLPTDHVFLNKLGKPYTKDCLVRKMERLRDRAEIGAKGGERIVLYSNRHTFGTDNAGKVSDIELAEVMGHTETRMTRRYVHSSAERLRAIQRRLQVRPEVRGNASTSGNGRSAEAAADASATAFPPATLPTPVPQEALTQAVS
jgi:integrase